MAGKDAGVEARCPGCGQTVLQKAMIPVLAEGGGVAYLCRDCARLHIQIEPVAKPAAEAETATEAPAEEAESTSASQTKSRTRRAPRPDRPLRARAPRAADA